MALLKVTKRTEVGSRKVRPLRKQGLIPGVIYGHGEEVLSVTLNEHDVDLAIHHGERLLELDLEGKKENVLIKDVQYDTFGQHVLHVDLTRVSLDERVEVTIPIVLRGTPAGAVEGGVLQQAHNEIHIECLVTAIPEDIKVSVNELNINDSIHASDVELPQGAKLLDDPEMLICSVSVIAEEIPAEEVEEEAAAEPEVIGEKKEEEEQEEQSE